MNDIEELIAVDPGYVSYLRTRGVILSIGLTIGALVLAGQTPVPLWAALLAAGLAALWLILIAPPRRYQRLGYALGRDCLRVSSGYLFHSDTVVPLGRIQHIDVDQGPISKMYDLARLTVHTAGQDGAAVEVPGLHHEQALAMREAIRAHIGAAKA